MCIICNIYTLTIIFGAIYFIVRVCKKNRKVNRLKNLLPNLYENIYNEKIDLDLIQELMLNDDLMNGRFTDVEVQILNDKFGFFWKENSEKNSNKNLENNLNTNLENNLNINSEMFIVDSKIYENNIIIEDKETDIEISKSLCGENITVCSICCDGFKRGQRCVKLPECGHVFCDNCIINWMKIKVMCPYCRNNVRRSMIREFHFEKNQKHTKKEINEYLDNFVKKETEITRTMESLLPEEFRPINDR